MNIVKQVQLESPIFAMNKAAQLGSIYPLAAKISACKAGTWHTILYKGESKDVPGLVKYTNARLQLGRYENFAEVREARENGIGKKSIQSNDIFYKNGIVYNVKSEKFRFKFVQREILEVKYLYNNFPIDEKQARQMIASATMGKKKYVKKIDIDFRRINFENIISFR